MKNWNEEALDIAAFRYRLISEFVEGQAEAITQGIEEVSQKTHINNKGKEIKVSKRTLWRWVEKYKKLGFAGLIPKQRKDKGRIRAIPADILKEAARLRKELESRPTKSIIDIIERKSLVKQGDISRSTLDRHLLNMGLSRRNLGSLGEKTYRKVHTERPMELIIADFHHGPYVLIGDSARVKKARLLVFIDHYSRYIVEGRYYLHEDYEALRFGFRRVLLLYGLLVKLYIDNGPSFQSKRFHAGCESPELNIQVVHSKPYVSEGRGGCERFNKTVKEQFENEANARTEPLTLDELNAFFEAWLKERYHRDIHSETGEAPEERFHRDYLLNQAPELERIEELFRLREKRKVHKKWSTVQVQRIRYTVSPALKGLKVFVLYDPFDPDYVLIERDGHIIERAYPQKLGEEPEQPKDKPPEDPWEPTDYLELLRQDYEKRVQDELKSLDLRPQQVSKELSLPDLRKFFEHCRDSLLSDLEQREIEKFFRKFRPIEPETARQCMKTIERKLGKALHIKVYIDELGDALILARTKNNKGENK